MSSILQAQKLRSKCKSANVSCQIFVKLDCASGNLINAKLLPEIICECNETNAFRKCIDHLIRANHDPAKFAKILHMCFGNYGSVIISSNAHLKQSLQNLCSALKTCPNLIATKAVLKCKNCDTDDDSVEETEDNNGDTDDNNGINNGAKNAAVWCLTSVQKEYIIHWYNFQFTEMETKNKILLCVTWEVEHRVVFFQKCQSTWIEAKSDVRCWCKGRRRRLWNKYRGLVRKGIKISLTYGELFVYCFSFFRNWTSQYWMHCKKMVWMQNTWILRSLHRNYRKWSSHHSRKSLNHLEAFCALYSCKRFLSLIQFNSRYSQYVFNFP